VRIPESETKALVLLILSLLKNKKTIQIGNRIAMTPRTASGLIRNPTDINVK
jgi:hypothetical protein